MRARQDCVVCEKLTTDTSQRSNQKRAPPYKLMTWVSKHFWINNNKWVKRNLQCSCHVLFDFLPLDLRLWLLRYARSWLLVLLGVRFVECTTGARGKTFLGATDEAAERVLFWDGLGRLRGAGRLAGDGVDKTASWRRQTRVLWSTATTTTSSCSRIAAAA